MSEKTMVKVGIVVDSVNTGSFAAAKKIKTSLKNVRTLVTMEKAITDEMKLYQEAMNTYITTNGEGEGDKAKIDTSNPVTRNKYIAHVIEVREENTTIEKLNKPIFNLDELEKKGIEFSADEATLLGKFGIIDFDMDIEEGEESDEKEVIEEEVEIDEIAASKVEDTPEA